MVMKKVILIIGLAFKTMESKEPKTRYRTGKFAKPQSGYAPTLVTKFLTK